MGFGVWVPMLNVLFIRIIIIMLNKKYRSE